MAIRTYKPTTPARRGMTTRDMSAITSKKPAKSLLVRYKPQSGRNNQGKITTRHRSGGVKKFYRLVDFKGNPGMSYKVLSIEYDPNRSANIARVEDETGKLSYFLADSRTRVGKAIKVDEAAPIVPGNRLKIAKIPVGSQIYNIELNAGKGGQLVRSAGTRAQLVSKEGDWAQVRLPSGEVRLIHLNCYATLGTVGNEQHQNIKWGSAGRMRRLGRRPRVAGKAMNPADHPMGGGEGKSSPGRLPRTPWGKIAIGPKTRRRKVTNKMIVRHRKSGRR
jgi:large subunit ribosomal protein L2